LPLGGAPTPHLGREAGGELEGSRGELEGGKQEDR